LSGLNAILIPDIHQQDYLLKNKSMKDKVNQCTPASSAVYGLGLIGAAIYFISAATGFWMGVLGFLKAIIWPVFLVLEAFKALAS